MAPDSEKQLSPYRVLTDPLLGDDLYSGDGFSNADEPVLREYLRVVRKHRALITGVVLFSVLAVTALIVSLSPMYTAVTTVQIDRQAPNVAPVQEVQQIDAAQYDKYDYYQTQYKILESRSIAARVIKKLGLQNDERFVSDLRERSRIRRMVDTVRSFLPVGLGGRAPSVSEMGVDSDLIDRYVEALGIDPVKNSRLVKVSFTSHSPELSAEVANQHVEEYMGASLDERLQTTARAKDFLEQELAKARARVVGTEASLNAFRKSKGVISLDGDKSDIVSARLDDLNKRYTEAQADRIRLEGQYRLIQQRDEQSLPDVLASPLVAQLKQDLARVESERAQLSRKFMPGYPKLAEVIAQEQQLRARVEAEVRKIVAGIASGFLAAENRERQLARELEEARQAALSQKDVGADFDTMKRDVDTARGLYASLLQRLKDVDVAEEIKVSNVSLVDRAATPATPSYPRKALSLIAAVIGGLAAGLGLSFLIEFLDNTVKTPSDVTTRLRLPTLGIVPAFDTPGIAYSAEGKTRVPGAPRRKRTSSAKGMGKTLATVPAVADKSSEVIVHNSPRSVVAEAYRSIRTRILLSSAGAPPQVILFTSGASGEGKTVTAVNQAVTLVQSGGRVLMIDADVRKPRLHRVFHLPNGSGLSTVLAGQTNLEQCTHEISLNGRAATHGDISGRLFVLPSGPPPPNPAELLGSGRMRDLLRELRSRFDYIVIDSPPILPVTDAVILSPSSDGVVLVVRAQSTPTAVSQESRDRLRSVHAKLLGVVLNDVNLTSGDYQDYQQYYHSYYADIGASAE